MAYSATTNLSLRKTVDEHRIDVDFCNIETDLKANIDIIEKTLAGETAIATNATLVNTSGSRIVNLYCCSAGSIATITGMLTNVPFTLVQRGSGASFGLCDVSPFLLNSADFLTKTGSNLTLIWNGTNYIEIGRIDP
jgi:hypothetical protein